MTGRYIAVDVRIFEHPVLAGERFTRHVAWLWIIANAAWKEHRVRVGEALVTLQRGQVIIGRAYLAKRWGWTEKQVRHFLDVLAAEGMIEKGRSHGRIANIATVCNYDKYQSSGSTEGPVGGPVDGQFRAGSGPHSTNTTKDTNNTDSASGGGDGVAGEHASDQQREPQSKRPHKPSVVAYPADFEAAWSRYPERGRNGKPAAFKHWLTMPPSHREKLPGCIDAYKAYLARQKRDSNFEQRPKDFSGFLNAATSKGGATYVDYLDRQPPANASANGHAEPADNWRKPEFAWMRK